MKQHIIDYVKQFDHTLVSPIWGGEKTFEFLCYGHLDMAEALGFELENVSSALTIVKENQLTSQAQLDGIVAAHKFDYSGFEDEIESLREMKEQERGGLCGGGCFGPLTVVSGIIGAERMLKMIVRNPDLVENFVAYVTEWIMELAIRETKADQDFFWIAEPLASLLAPKRFWKFSGQYLKKIYDAAGVPGFLHVCGKTIAHTPYMVETGAEVLSIDYCTDIGECIRMVDANTVIMGNVNPSTLRFGTKEDVEAEVCQIMNACENFPNFVLSTGCSIMENTPDENMQVLFDLAANKGPNLQHKQP
jgi:uroporphyrinogen decarboxylase